MASHGNNLEESWPVSPGFFRFFSKLSIIFLILAIITDRRIYSWFIHLQETFSAYQQRLLDFISTPLLLSSISLFALNSYMFRRSKRISPNDRIVRKYRNFLLIIILLFIILFLSLLFFEILFELLGWTPIFQSAFHKIHQISDNPNIVYELKPSSQVNMIQNKRRITYTINSQGFRYREFDHTKKDDIYRILAVGDSVVFGFGIQAEERFTNLLEENLNKNKQGNKSFEVINTGVGGWNAYNEAAFLKARGMALKPDLLLLGFCYNDINEPSLDFETHTFEKLGNLPIGIFPNPEIAYQNNRWKIRPETIGLKDLFLTYALHYSAFLSWAWTRIDWTLHRKQYENLRIFDHQFGILSDPKTIEWNWLRQQYGKIMDLCNRAGVSCVLIIFPVSYQVTDPPGRSDAHFKVMIHTFEEMGFHVYNPLPDLKKHDGKNFYINQMDFTHFNLEGQRIIADGIYRQLHECGILAKLEAKREIGRSGMMESGNRE